MAQPNTAIVKACELGIPEVFILDACRADLTDIGRETDSNGDVDCLGRNPTTALAESEPGMPPSDERISKRRYLAFYGTDLEGGLEAQTLYSDRAGLQDDASTRLEISNRWWKHSPQLP